MRKGWPEAYTFIFVMEVMPVLPLWLIRFFASIIFLIAYPFIVIFGLERRFKRNINAAFGGERSKREIAAIAREAIYIQIVGLMEVTHYVSLKRREDLLKNVKIIGLEKVNRAKREGIGAIGLTAHLGNFQLTGVRLGAEKEINSCFLVKDPKAKALTDVWYGYMKKLNLKKLSFTDRTDVEKMIVKALNESAFIMMVADEHKRRGVKTDFFGKETRMAAGPAVISLKTGAKLLPMFIIREKKSKYTLYIEDPIDFNPTGDREEDVMALTQLRTRALEKYVRRYPGQWLWLHSHWKRR